MAVQFDASGELYTRSVTGPSTWSAAFWIRPTSDTDHGPFGLGQADAGGAAVFLSRMGTNTLKCFDLNNNGGGFGSFVYTLNTWSAHAITVSGTDCSWYHGTSADALSVDSVANITNPTGGTQTWFLGSDTFTAQWWRGLLANFKIYDALLGAGEVANELARYLPSRTSNMIQRHTFLVAETVDYSGNGNTLSGGTGAATADGPPIPWGAAPIILGKPSAAAGTNAAAECATANGSANDSTATVAATAESVAATAVSNDPAASVGASAEHASITVVAGDPTATVSMVVEGASSTAVAEQPTVLTGTVAAAEVSAGTGVAENPALTVAPTSESLVSTATAETPAMGVATASDASTASGAAHDPAAAVGASAESATAASVAQDSPTAVSPTAEAAAASSAASDATVNTSGQGSASAGSAEATAVALDAAVTILIGAQDASGSAAANDASVSTSAGTNAAAELAAASVLALDPAALIAPSLTGPALGQSEASDATIATAVIALAESTTIASAAFGPTLHVMAFAECAQAVGSTSASIAGAPWPPTTAGITISARYTARSVTVGDRYTASPPTVTH